MKSPLTETMSYRADIPEQLFETKKTAPAQDEANFSTLKEIQRMLEQNLFDLEKNFNSFAVLGEKDKEVAARNLLIDIEARQIAFSIIANVKAAVDSAVSGVKNINT